MPFAAIMGEHGASRASITTHVLTQAPPPQSSKISAQNATVAST